MSAKKPFLHFGIIFLALFALAYAYQYASNCAKVFAVCGLVGVLLFIFNDVFDILKGL